MAQWKITLGWPQKPQVHHVLVSFWLFDYLHICLGMCTTKAQYQLDPALLHNLVVMFGVIM